MPSPASSTSAAPATGVVPPRFHWSVRTLFTMLATFLMMIPLLAAALVLQALVPNPTTEADFLLGNVPSLLVPFGAIGLVWVFMRYIDRRPLRQAGLFVDRRTLPTFVLGTVLLIALQVGAVGLTTSLGFSYPSRAIEAGALLWTVDLLARALVHASFCEELLFRGYLMQTLPQRSPWVVATISAIAFGLLHMLSQGQSGVLDRFAYAAGPTGWAFLAGALVVVFRNLAPAVGVHFGSYLASDVARVIGWGEGPAAWVATGVVSAAVGAAILFWHGRRHPEMPRPLFEKA